MLREFATLDEALAAGRLATQADELRLYKRIATMDSAAPVPELSDQIPTWDRAAVLAREWSLNNLALRLDQLERAKGIEPSS